MLMRGAQVAHRTYKLGAKSGNFIRRTRRAHSRSLAFIGAQRCSFVRKRALDTASSIEVCSGINRITRSREPHASADAGAEGGPCASRVSPAPICPRCNSGRYVTRGVPGCSPFSWVCLDCLQRVRHLDLAVLIWRLWEEIDQITRDAA
jgi:hypothetical protein